MPEQHDQVFAALTDPLQADPDRVPLICAWFKTRGFDLQWLSERDAGFGVGVHRFAGEPQPLAAGRRMFTFVRYDGLTQAKARAGS